MVYFLENVALSISLGKQSVQYSTHILWTNFRPRAAFELFAVILHMLIFSVTGHMVTFLILGWMMFSNKKRRLDTLLLVQNFSWMQPYENVLHQCFLDTRFWKKAYLCEWKFVKNSNTETSWFYRSRGWWLISESSKLWFRALQSRNVSLAQTECMPVFKGHGCHRSVT